MIHPLTVCAVSDWDLYEKLLDHVLAKHVKTESEYHPFLMSESPVRNKLVHFACISLVGDRFVLAWHV